MITRDTAAFVAFARGCPEDFGPPTAKAAFLVSPDGFARADESARDNHYMAADGFDAWRALQQHRALHVALSADLPVACFAGDPGMPDGLFPNNVFATVPGRLVIGRMRHPVRQREALRQDIRAFFRDACGYVETDLSTQPHPCELTGALVIDRARGLGFCGLSDRCDEEGAALMHAAFGLRATLLFDLAPGEYHTNVVLALLAGRAAVLAPGGFADPAVAEAIAGLYAPHVARLSAAEQAAFAGNAIALSPSRAWMSQAAADALSPGSRQVIGGAGFGISSVPLSAIEVAGGSLRCCVAEIF
ncbi:amidinotransferase [Luteimonas aestuarii]|uniref:Amidinotransferase n=1 Tax=Luteimonas aestuarii TaxID=453837 RepID=A0A4R5TQ57_9GAMM|nr:arginine deiminase-related protein [Luteimonas aestuarii]TDK24349.1 amidinotransferase [Luteimonas aestuarii]